MTTTAEKLHELLADPRDTPAYSTHEAAGYLHIPPATLRSWVKGRTYETLRGEEDFLPVIAIADPAQSLLSFNDLVEAHLLRALRTKHTVPLRKVREALRFAEEEFGIERPLLSGELRTAAGDIFLEHYHDLVSLSRSGQIALRRFFDEHLERIAFEDDRPVRLHPFLTRAYGGESRSVAIDPRVSFGRPVITDRGVTTEAIARRIDAGETVEDLAYDYGIPEEQIEDAIIFERAA